MALSGKVVFITGAAQGLGRGFAEAVLENGAKVFFGDVNSDIGVATLGELQARFGAANVRFAAFDVTNHQKFKGAFEQAVAEFGHVDVMVNNAGIMNEAVWELMININFVSLVLGTKLATEHMRRDQGGRGGRIINISSTAGLNHISHVPVYCSTKHAVRSFTSSLALQPNIQAQGIEYGVLCPHTAATDLILKADSDSMFFYDTMNDRMRAIAMPVQTVVAGFMELLQLEKMNGAILMVMSDGKTYRKMENNQDTDRA